MKRILTIVLMLASTLFVGAQSISVDSFRLLENNYDANSPGTMERDQNGEVAALIKVVTTQTGFSFDGGALGIVKTRQKAGEIWVFVPGKSKKITIMHPDYLVLRDFYYPCSIKAGHTYEMILVTKGRETYSNLSRSFVGEANINSNPMMADVYIDDKKMGQTPLLVTDIASGSHVLRLSKKGYSDYLTNVIIDNKPCVVSVDLEADPDEMSATSLSDPIGVSSVVSTDGNIDFNILGVPFSMIRVDGGTFQMGNDQGGQYEKPVHQVTLSSYYIGETEVTQQLWNVIMGNNYSKNKGPLKPVTRIEWDEANEFINRLNKISNRQFRLPTEAEWEYAAKGGNKSQGFKYSGSNIFEEVAWKYDYLTTHDVKTKASNELGLYDMSGNVWEWVQDWAGEYSPDPQFNPKGPSEDSGLTINFSRVCRSDLTERYFFPSGKKDDLIGFRLALDETLKIE